MAHKNERAPLDRESQGEHDTNNREHHTKPAASAPPPTEITDWRPFISNTMKGLFSCLLPSGLLIHGYSLHVGAESQAWICPPSKRRLRDGQIAFGPHGKTLYDKMVEIPDPSRWEAFKEAVFCALRGHSEAALCLPANTNGGGHGNV